MHRLSVQIMDHEWDALRAEAFARKRTLTSIVRDALSEHFLRIHRDISKFTEPLVTLYQGDEVVDEYPPKPFPQAVTRKKRDDQQLPHIVPRKIP